MTPPGLVSLSAAGDSLAFFDPFALHARIDFDLHDRESFAANFPVLLHEYLHYLQSISTVYGLHRVLDWIRTGVRLASVLPNVEQIRVPLRTWRNEADCPEPVRVQMAEIWDRLRLTDELEQATTVHNTVAFTVGPLRVSNVPFSDGLSYIVAIHRIDDAAAIPIGARALAEGMSASVQRLWEEEPRVDQVLAGMEPEDAGWYTATRSILAEIIGSDQDLDAINVFVCDTAMMTSNPSASFIAAVAAIVGAGARTRPAVFAAVREALQPILAEESAFARTEIAEMLARLGDSEEPFAQAVRRLLTSSDELLARRGTDPDFPIEILCGDQHRQLQALLASYPLPCYFQGSKFLTWHDDEDLARLGEELLMMEHALRILIHGPGDVRACPLAASTSCPAPKTYLCRSAPWRIGMNAEGEVCAFGGAMYTFGALGKILIAEP